MTRELLCFCVFACSLAGQHTRGVVIEPGTNLPIADAVVTVRKVRPVGVAAPPGPRDNTPLDVVTTGPDGRFSFDIAANGSYVVETHKDGYVPSGPLLRSSPTSARVELDGSKHEADLRFLLARRATLTGQVVDEETGHPIPRLLMSLLQPYFESGVRRVTHGVGLAISRPDGKFNVSNARPGDVLLEVQWLIDDQPRVLQDFSKADVDKVDLGYRRTVWPGGHDIGTASPIPVFSGTALSFGTLTLRKEPLYRVHLTFAKGACEAGSTIRLYLFKPEKLSTDTLLPVVCDKGVLLTGLSPGDYKLLGYTEAQFIEAQTRGVVDLHIGDRNVEAVMHLVRGVDIAGRVVVREGVRMPLVEKLGISLRAPYRAPATFEDVTVAVDDSGGFGFINKEAGDQELVVKGLPDTHYVKQIRLAGAVVRGDAIPLSGAAVRQSLEIELDDKPVTIGGKVSDDGRPVPQVFAALARVPFNVADVPYRLITAVGQSDGSFQFTGLAPGEYQVIAVPLASRYRLDEPAILSGLLNQARTVKLEPGGFRSLDLQLLKP